MFLRRMNGRLDMFTLVLAILVASSIHPASSFAPRVGWQRQFCSSCLYSSSSADNIRPEYAALEPGTVVRVQVGDVALSRKAWKKRRRSGSPLLVPCSVLDMDRESMVRWNILYLIEKHGVALSELQESLGFTGRGVALSHSQVGKLYKQHMGTSLNKHAQALGYDSSRSLFRSLFDRKAQKEYGLKMWLPKAQQDNDTEDDNDTDTEKDDVSIKVDSIVGRRAVNQSEESDDDKSSGGDEYEYLVKYVGGPEAQFEWKTVAEMERMDESVMTLYHRFLQKMDGKVDEGDGDGDDAETVVQNVAETDEVEDRRPIWLVIPISRHRARDMASQAALVQFQAVAEETEDKKEAPRMRHTGKIRVRSTSKQKQPYKYLPLSAALRVSQRDVDDGRIRDGSIYESAVFSFDTTGDGGSPLLTMALKNSNNSVSHRIRRLKSVKQVSRSAPLKMDLKDLKVGDGPFDARVLDLRNREAFVDCGVGRQQSKQRGGGVTRVMGMLRFDDLVSHSQDNESFPAKTEIDILDEHEAQDEEDEDDISFVDDLFNIVDEEIDEEVEEEEEVVAGEDDAATGEELKELFSMFRDELSDEEASVLEEAMASESTRDGGTASFEEDGNEGAAREEDITDMFSVTDDGVTYQDADTGETLLIDDEEEDVLDDSYDDDDDDDSDFQALAGLGPEERLDAIAKLMQEDEDDSLDSDSFDAAEQTTASSDFSDSYEAPMFLKVGDTVPVYIKSISKQSGRFMVTTDPSIVGRKAKDIKRKQEANKKLSRLAAKFGDEGLEKILNLKGTECDGVVKATSNTGNWFFVQPSLEDLPVGVAAPCEDSSSITQGDTVRVRLEGIDESRGQLAMTVLEKLTP